MLERKVEDGETKVMITLDLEEAQLLHQMASLLDKSRLKKLSLAGSFAEMGARPAAYGSISGSGGLALPYLRTTEPFRSTECSQTVYTASTRNQSVHGEPADAAADM